MLSRILIFKIHPDLTVKIPREVYPQMVSSFKTCHISFRSSLLSLNILSVLALLSQLKAHLFSSLGGVPFSTDPFPT